MKRIRVSILMILILIMSVPMASTSFAAVKDYATLQWDVNLGEVSDVYEGTVRLTLTGVVGQQVDKNHVNTAVLPAPYYYEGPFVGQPDYSPNEPSETAPITGYSVYSSEFDGEEVIAPKDQLAATIIALAEKTNATKVTDLKLIPIVEGATMTIQLIDCTYYQFTQFFYEAFPGTSPLLLTEVDYGNGTYSLQMWADENPVASHVYKKIINENGTYQVYPFPDEYNTLDTPIAFYVVTEAEAKALMGTVKTTGSTGIAANNATPTSSKVMVDGTNVSFDAYNIAGSNYFKLRDLAEVVSGTGKQFDVGYDDEANAITLTIGISYADASGEVSTGDGKAKSATATKSKIYVDGNETPFTAYNIGGNNYFKLRDVAKELNIGVGYDEATKVITIDTSLDYEK